MRMYLTIESNIKTQEEFDKKIKNIYPDDVVFFINGDENNDGKYVHLDFAEFSYNVVNEKIRISVKALGETWDSLNEEYGIFPKDINYELLLNGIVDNYVIIADLNEEYVCEYNKDDFTSDGLYKDFKLLEIGFFNENNEKILFTIDEDASNTDDL